jgi:hypothetical protein
MWASARLHADSHKGCRPIKERQTMRIARKLTLRAMLALAATALAAPSAFAQTEPLVHNQNPQIIVQGEVHGNTDTTCTQVLPSPAPNPSPPSASGGCVTHASATSVQLWAHLSAGGTEVLIGNCNVEFDLRTDAAGEGYVTHQEFTAPTQGGGGSCSRRACGQVTPPTSEGRAWSFYMRESEPAPTERLTVLFCTEPIGGGAASHCEVTVPISEPTAHNYEFVVNDASGHGTIFPHCELASGQGATFRSEAVLGVTGEGATEQRLEVRHQ